MCDLPDGKYLIVLAPSFAPPTFPVGANEHGAVSPVVVKGRNRIWTAEKKENGNYTLILEQTGPRLLSQDGGDKVIVVIMPLPGEWTIRKQAFGTYTIEVPSDRWPSKAWTLDDPKPGTEVTLGVYELPRPGQLWYFIPIPVDDE